MWTCRQAGAGEQEQAGRQSAGLKPTAGATTAGAVGDGRCCWLAWTPAGTDSILRALIIRSLHCMCCGRINRTKDRGGKGRGVVERGGAENPEPEGAAATGRRAAPALGDARPSLVRRQRGRAICTLAFGAELSSTDDATALLSRPVCATIQADAPPGPSSDLPSRPSLPFFV